MTVSLIDPTAIVDSDAEIAEGVTVGAYTIIGPDVSIGEGTTIGSHCAIGDAHGRLTIGKRAVIRSHTVVYGGSTFGDELETGHHATLREHLKVGRNLRVGTVSDLQGDAEMGDCVRLHSNVHIGKNSMIGDFVWIFPYVVLTNDPHPPSEGYIQGPTIERGAVIATMSVILPGIRVGEGSLVAAGAVVTKDVAPGRVVRGAPAKDVAAVEDVRWSDPNREGSPYPWWHHFRRGYPAEAQFGEDGPVLPGGPAGA